MSALGAVFSAKLRLTRNTLASVRRESKLKVGLVSFSTVLLWGGAFYVARKAFQWLEALGGPALGLDSMSLGDVVMARLLALFALALFALLIFSNVLVSFATLYRSKEVAFLVQSPLTWRTLFLARFWECVSLSSWASAFLGSPILLAYGLETGAPWSFYAALVAVYLPFVVLPAALGAMVTMVLVRVVTSLGRRSLAVAGVLLGGAAAGAYLFFRGSFRAADLTGTATLQTLLEAAGGSQSALLPSQWASRAVLGAATGDGGEALFHLGLLLANALFATWLAAEVAAALYPRGLSAFLGLDRQRLKLPGKGLLGRLEIFLRPLPEPGRSLWAKDIRLFWRDVGQWSQFVLFFGIMALYAANMRKTSSAYEPELWRSWITLLNVTVSMLILATLTTRFIFPLISLEGRRFWILGLAPMTLEQLLRQKLLLSVATTSVFSLGLVGLTAFRLEMGAVETAVSLFTVVAANLALSGLAVGLGSLYPNFAEDNPARIVSGMGGTLNFILSMVFVVLMGVAQTLVLQWKLIQDLSGSRIPHAWVLGGGLAFMAVLSAVTCAVPLKLGLRNLERGDL